jgi:hypothetical protein
MHPCQFHEGPGEVQCLSMNCIYKMQNLQLKQPMMVCQFASNAASIKCSVAFIF